MQKGKDKYQCSSAEAVSPQTSQNGSHAPSTTTQLHPHPQPHPPPPHDPAATTTNHHHHHHHHHTTNNVATATTPMTMGRVTGRDDRQGNNKGGRDDRATVNEVCPPLSSLNFLKLIPPLVPTTTSDRCRVTMDGTYLRLFFKIKLFIHPTLVPTTTMTTTTTMTMTMHKHNCHHHHQHYHHHNSNSSGTTHTTTTTTNNFFFLFQSDLLC
jgi:hypothetical protein